MDPETTAIRKTVREPLSDRPPPYPPHRRTAPASRVSTSAPALRRPSGVGRAALLAAAAALLAPDGAASQRVEGRVVERSTSRPVPSAMVWAVNDDGVALTGDFTGLDGRFALDLPEAGRFRLLAERVGFRTTGSPAVEVADGATVRVVVRAPAQPVALFPLDGFDGTGGDPVARCATAPGEESATGRLWREARKALTAARWTQLHAGLRYRLVRYEREVGPGLPSRDGRILSADTVTVPAAAPVGSLTPDELLAGGFVRPDGRGGWLYDAPDPALLLSPVFAETHCFGAAETVLDGDLAMGFEPIGDSSRLGLRGSLRVDRASGSLRTLAFTFPWLPWSGLEHGPFGGELRFERVPGEGWIVRGWSLRMPIAVDGEDEGRAARLAAVREVGAEVLEVVGPDGATVAGWPGEPGRLGRIEGAVLDSVHAVPLEGARVRVLDTPWSAVADAWGRFSFPFVPAGRYRLAFDHPRLDSLGIEIAPTPVTVDPSREEEVLLATASIPALLIARCRDEKGAATGVVAGRVTASGGEVGVGSAAVLLADERGIPVERTTSSSGGWFVLCDAPAPRDYSLVARFPGIGQSNAVAVSLEEGGTEVRDLAIGELTVAASPELRVVDRTTVRDALAVVGHVQDPAGHPVAHASVVARDSTGTPRLHVLADEQGAFRGALPEPGRYTLSVERLGYEPLQGELTAAADGVSRLEVRLATRPVPLEGITAVSAARSTDLETAGFYERRAGGFGLFLDRQDLEHRIFGATADIFNGLPRVRVDKMDHGAAVVYFAGSHRVGDQVACFPRVYLDGYMVLRGGAEPARVDEVIDASDVAAVEVYRGPSETPVRYRSRNGCGAILIWTRTR